MSEINIAERAIEYVLTREIWEFQDINVDSIAREFSVSRTYLSHRFKCEKKFSLNDFILLAKIIKSTLLLKENPDLTIEKLSKMMGFANANYFIIVFKNKVGITPGKYKNLLTLPKSIKSFGINERSLRDTIKAC
jgi:AraC-like DNA-binding protein